MTRLARKTIPCITKKFCPMHSFATATEPEDIADSLRLTALNNALSQSMTWCMPDDGSRDMSNALRSSHFCFMAGTCLPKFTSKPGKVRHIRFNDTDIKRESGEWLLDAVMVECNGNAAGKEGIVSKIHVAMECESSTALKAFFVDFSKLLHIKSETKIYLQGLNQRRESSARSFIDERLEMAAKYIQEIDSTSTWYFGFWPSPLALNIDADDRSLWADLNRGNHKHLKKIELYKFNGRKFIEIRQKTIYQYPA